MSVDAVRRAGLAPTCDQRRARGGRRPRPISGSAARAAGVPRSSTSVAAAAMSPSRPPPPAPPSRHTIFRLTCWQRSPPRRPAGVSTGSKPGRAAPRPCPSRTRSSDAVLTRYSAHHWRDVPGGAGRGAAGAAADGLLVVSDIVAPEDPLLDTHLQAVELLRDPSHVRDYRVSEWRALLEAAGFEPGAVMASRPRMDFASWIARMRTPEIHVAAIRALLQATAPAEVTAHFGIEADGSFLLRRRTDRGDPEAWPLNGRGHIPMLQDRATRGSRPAQRGPGSMIRSDRAPRRRPADRAQRRLLAVGAGPGLGSQEPAARLGRGAPRRREGRPRAGRGSRGGFCPPFRSASR